MLFVITQASKANTEMTRGNDHLITYWNGRKIEERCRAKWHRVNRGVLAGFFEQVDLLTADTLNISLSNNQLQQTPKKITLITW